MYINDKYSKLNNNSEIVGPYLDPSILFCASSGKDSVTSWYSSNDGFNKSLQIDNDVSQSPLLSEIQTISKDNLTLVSINLKMFIKTTDFEAVFLCLGVAENFSLVNNFISVYLQLPSE